MVEQKFVDWDLLVYYDGKIKTYIADLSEEFLKSGGEVTFENLPRPGYDNVNYIYKILDEFVSNEDFETPNVSYRAGCFVQVCDFDKNSTYRYSVMYEPNFATESYVDQKIQDAVFDASGVNLDNYYTKKETDSAIQSALPIKVSELENDAKYVTESNLTEYVKQTDLPDFDAFATKKFVTDTVDAAVTSGVDLTNYYDKDEIDDLIEGIEVPEVPTNVSAFTNDANYATKQEVEDAIKDLGSSDIQDIVTFDDLREALGTKADAIPFTKNYVVTKDVGGFSSGDPLMNMTLVEILTTLLGATLEQSSTVVETIVQNEIPAYVGTSSSGPDVTSYQNLNINDKAFKDDGVTPLVGFYTNDDQTKAGYQLELPAQDDDDGAVILIPAAATVVAVYQWASLLNTWSSSDLEYFKIDGTVTHTVNNIEVVYNRYVWDEETYGGVIYSSSNWRFEIEV